MTMIAVYADWDALSAPLRLGLIHARKLVRREVFEFEFDAAALAHPALAGLRLDPRLGPFAGRQFPPQDSVTFGFFGDAGPGDWGRALMRRRFERDQRAWRAERMERLRESDFLLGVPDTLRTGALRFRLDDAGPFLDDDHGQALPAFARLRELEAASLGLERDTDNAAADADTWLRLLLVPGSALGGARPKAVVADPDGRQWIAKFPSANDEHDAGAWELLLNTLARRCGLRVPPGIARRVSGFHHTFLARRIDRTDAGRRLHFASAQTLLDRSNGASTRASYLDLARVLIEQGAQTAADLRELWSRLVFNVCVSCAGDHLRNHGFILVPGQGWRLSEAFGLNPVPDAQGLSLNINETNNALDLDLVRSVAPYFRVDAATAATLIERIAAVVAQWPKLAAHLAIPAREQERMAEAFRHGPPQPARHVASADVAGHESAAPEVVGATDDYVLTLTDAATLARLAGNADAGSVAVPGAPPAPRRRARKRDSSQQESAQQPESARQRAHPRQLSLLDDEPPP